MRNLITNFAIAATMTSLFVAMLGVQVGGIATAAIAAKTETTYAVSSNPYLPIQMIEPAY
jgi:hypothetical protein